jgi:hypothetical protein
MALQKKYSKRLCPSCHMDDKIISSKISSPYPSESLSFRVNKESWEGLFYKKTKSFFSYYKCSNCKLIYAPEHYSSEQLNNIYKQTAPNMEQVPKKLLKKTQYEYFQLLKKWSDFKGNYLEVGPDIGLFTQLCTASGNFDYFWLFEPNNLVKSSLTKLLGSRKHKIYPTIDQIDKIDNNILSTVILIHVLDHLLEPQKILKKLRQKMKLGGVILIVTHDESSMMRKFFGWRWLPFCQQHPQLFNYKTTKDILNRSGFKVLEQRKSKNFFEISFLLNNLLWAFGFKTYKFPNLLNISVGLRLGNIITVASAED